MHEINCDSDDGDDETTEVDAGKEVAEAQTADDPQQNDVCEVCLVAAWTIFKQQQLRCPLCRTENQMMLRLF